MSTDQPLITIQAVFTSIKAAVIAVLTIVAIQLQMDEVSTAAFIGAGAAITTAVGDVLALLYARPRVTPVADPALAAGTTVTLLDAQGVRTNQTGTVVQ